MIQKSFLNNRMLYTGGMGFDIVSFYDTCIRLEYSINQLGQKGLFLHTKVDMWATSCKLQAASNGQIHKGPY